MQYIVSRGNQHNHCLYYRVANEAAVARYLEATGAPAMYEVTGVLASGATTPAVNGKVWLEKYRLDQLRRAALESDTTDYQTKESAHVRGKINEIEFPPEGNLRYAVMVYETADGENWKIVHVARKGLALDDVPEILITLIADAVYTLSDGDTEDERAEIVARAMAYLDLVCPASDKPAQ